MKFLFVLLLLVCTLPQSIALAQHVSEKDCSALLQAALLQKNELYHCDGYDCANNVKRLIARLKELSPQFDVSKANVYIISSSSGVRAFSTLRGPELWRFHVVLEYNKRILDFDYAKADELPESSQYFNQMFRYPNSHFRDLYEKTGITHASEDEINNSLFLTTVPVLEYEKNSNILSIGDSYEKKPLSEVFPKLNLPDTIKPTTPELDWVLNNSQSLKIFDHGRYISWENGSFYFELSLKLGTVEMWNNKVREDHPEEIISFLRKVQLEVEQGINSELSNAINKSKTLRLEFGIEK